MKLRRLLQKHRPTVRLVLRWTIIAVVTTVLVGTVVDFLNTGWRSDFGRPRT